MTYTTNIPTPGQSLGETQPLILNNFNVLNTTIAQDHVSMNLAGQGKHNWITYVNPIPAIPVTAINEVISYKDVNNILNIRIQNSASDYKTFFGDLSAQDLARLGTQSVYDGGIPTQQGGWTMLPGLARPMILNYGHKDNPGSSGTITFAKPFTIGGNTPIPTLTLEGSTGNVGVVTVTASVFPGSLNYRISGSGTVTTLYFQVLGN